MKDICTETGAYLRNSLQGHYFDESLAKAITEVLKKESVDSVYDLGCGHGMYTKYLKDSFFSCSGFDGNPYTNNITSGLCNVLNLTEDITIPSADCVLCLEVGEHIPKKFEKILINNLSKSTSNLLILSWAIEGQLGEGHINCKNNDYIKNIFQSQGYKNISEYEKYLREESTLSWFKNTIMVFKNE